MPVTQIPIIEEENDLCAAFTLYCFRQCFDHRCCEVQLTDAWTAVRGFRCLEQQTPALFPLVVHLQPTAELQREHLSLLDMDRLSCLSRALALSAKPAATHQPEDQAEGSRLLHVEEQAVGRISIDILIGFSCSFFAAVRVGLSVLTGMPSHHLPATGSPPDV